MKASNMIKKMSSRILTAVMAVSLAMPLQVCARTLDDNPAGETVSIGAGDTMINNWGSISSNQGTLQNNAGIVTSNSGTIDNNYGRIINNAGGSVGINHTGGYVNTSTSASGGTVADNYGNVSNAIVENNYASGTVTGDGSEIDYNWGRATNVHLVVYNCGTVTTNNDPERFVEVNYARGFVDGVEGEGEGPVAENPTDPNPNAPVQPEISEENPFVTMIKTEIC
ncbi:MAG: hypothetical protein K5871_07840, partial [Lachnospiraceae bacterium]|nr:hypothetical protein [Lachnospiraceae bacterium]